MKKNFYTYENEWFFRYFSLINFRVIIDLRVERGDTMEEQRRHVNESKIGFFIASFLLIFLFFII
jgi:hypothetical protein